MSDIREEFKQWLQDKYNKPTAYSYCSLVQRIFDKNFEPTLDWQTYSDNIVPLLARYFEFANQGYYLDRVTVWYALGYFDKITDFIYLKQNSLYKNDAVVKISLYDGKKDYHITDTTLYNLNDYIKYIANNIFNQSHKLNAKNIDTFKTLLPLLDIDEQIKPIDIKDVAIHIDYKEIGNSAEKTVLSKYCDFLYVTTHSVVYLYPSNEIINLIKKENPNKTIDGNYKEIRPITGLSARQVEANMKVFRESPEGYPYTANDVAKIFDIDFNSTFALMDRFGKEFKIITVKNTYYGANAINACLEAYHHYKDKKDSEKYAGVDYSREGYQWWCTRKKALEILGIKKDAFYSHIAYECLYIDYAFGAPKYYIPEIEYFKNLPKIRRISRRNNNIIKKISS